VTIALVACRGPVQVAGDGPCGAVYPAGRKMEPQNTRNTLRAAVHDSVCVICVPWRYLRYDFVVFDIRKSFSLHARRCCGDAVVHRVRVDLDMQHADLDHGNATAVHGAHFQQTE
jgi:hypothetical protein